MLILVVLGWVVGLSGKRWRARFWTIAVVYTLLCTMPPAQELLTLLWLQFTPQEQPVKAQAIVVLGSGNSPEGTPLAQTAERAQRGAHLWLAGWAPVVVLSGGETVTSANTEARSMAIITRGLGVPPGSTLLEEDSVNTYENAVQCKKLLDRRQIHRILLVTSRVHLLRSTLTFRKQGFIVTPIPAEEQPLRFNWNPAPMWLRAEALQTLLNEYFGVLGYWVQGKL
ncbi:YdcF family protein [Anthocerotibacter panamensis]|uniref:YdcF family protein n=1 Tax=Anthocerotibacter panamensis TaxID=2857077 RepID=UPI001C407D20|nr:YdcF family protein [Anthocerotibacter panamensis]